MNTIQGRVKVLFETKEIEEKLVFKKVKFFLHIPITKKFPDSHLNEVCHVVGVENQLPHCILRLQDMTQFSRVVTKLAQYKRVRKSLQQKQTAT